MLGVAGFVLFKRGSKAQTSAKPASAYKNQGGVTGVARYVMRISGTGVSRYIEKNAVVGTAKSASAATGVAKYLASKSDSPAATAKKSATTGVEKYMRKKG